MTPNGVSVMPDTPMEAVTAWNAEALVALLVVSKSEICGASVSNGEVDFLVSVDCPGDTSYRWTTHETIWRNVPKMSLPDQGEVFAIPMNASRSSVKRPKIFWIPILSQVDLPTRCLIQGGTRHLLLSASG